MASFDSIPGRRSRSSLIEDLAEQVGLIFCEERRLFRDAPNLQRPSPKMMVEFRVLAEWLLDEQIGDVREYIHYQFARRRRASVPPTVSQCYGKTAKDAWLRRQRTPEERTEMLRERLTFEQHHYADCLESAKQMREIMSWTNDETSQFVLLDPDNQLSPLFRFCIASAELRLEAAARCQHMALRQLMTDRQCYETAWGRLIPRGLLSAADRYKATAGSKKQGVRHAS